MTLIKWKKKLHGITAVVVIESSVLLIFIVYACDMELTFSSTLRMSLNEIHTQRSGRGIWNHNVWKLNGLKLHGWCRLKFNSNIKKQTFPWNTLLLSETFQIWCAIWAGHLCIKQLIEDNNAVGAVKKMKGKRKYARSSTDPSALDFNSRFTFFRVKIDANVNSLLTLYAYWN